MPNIRSFLLIALAFVAFLLWQAWQTDYAQPPVAATGVATQDSAAQIPSDADADSVPGATDIPGPAPDAPVAPAPPAPMSDTAAAAAESDAPHVIVDTDVLRVEIDTQGGSVVRAWLLTYPIDPKRRDEPVVLLDNTPAHYVVAQSGLVSANGPAPDHRARYESPQRKYRLAEGAPAVEVPLVWHGENGLTVTKRFRFERGSYAIAVNHVIENGSGAPWSGSVYRQLQRSAPPPAGKFSFTNPEQYSFVGAAWFSPEEHFEKLKFDDFADEPLKREITGGWSALLQHYFFAAWLPPAMEKAQYSTEVIAAPTGPRYLIRQVAPAVSVAPGAKASLDSRLYVGPKLQEHVGTIAPGLESVIDYGKVTVLAEPLFWLLNQLHKLLGNWGFAIIALTFLIKLAFYKLSEAQYRSMARMRKLQPRLAALKERYGDDKQKMNQAMMELYQKEKINPFGGCLPILVQIPVFIALYWVLIESVELRQAPFILWIDNLSDKDPYFVLPVLNGLAMWAAQKLSPAAGMDPMQQKVMQLMPIMFAVMFAFFPAGLVLYWTVNGVLGLLQQWIITKRVQGSTAKA